MRKEGSQISMKRTGNMGKKTKQRQGENERISGGWKVRSKKRIEMEEGDSK